MAVFGKRFPRAVDYLISETVRRLEEQRAHMLEFIRKQNYEYQHEPLTDDEKNAWRAVLTFFSGYPGERFTHHIQKF